MKYRYVYKTICLCDDWEGKFYIGQHTTEDLNDGYAGSGIKIAEYFSKYGKKLNVTYRIKILKIGAKNQAQLDIWEKNYINKYLGQEKCLNIDEGGLYKRENKLDFHTVEQIDENTTRSCEDTENQIYGKNGNIPLYKTPSGKLYSKGIDLIKNGINIYN